MSELTVGTLSGLAANSYVVDVAAGSTLDLSNATDLPASALPAGSILQVVEGSYSTYTVISSTSYVSTGLTATITPSSTSSKILIMVHGTGQITGGTHTVFHTVFRGTTAGTDVNGGTALQKMFDNDATVQAYSFNTLDTPSTTSAQLYTVAAKVTGGNFGAQEGNTTSKIILMEVAG